MPYAKFVRIGNTRNDVQRILGPMVRYIELAEQLYDNNVADLKEIGTVAITAEEWAALLNGYPSTTKATLSINATTKVISCGTGLRLFKDFVVGNYVSAKRFVSAGNNFDYQEVTAKTDDSITIANATGLVDVTDDADAAVYVTPSAIETEEAQIYIDVYQIGHDFYEFLTTTNSYTSPSEPRITKIRKSTHVNV